MFTVNPVGRVSRLTPQNRKHERPKYQKSSLPASFASILDAEMESEEFRDMEHFDATA